MFNNPYFQTPNPYEYRPTSQLIRVTGIEGARAYQMGANSSAALFDDMTAVKVLLEQYKK